MNSPTVTNDFFFHFLGYKLSIGEFTFLERLSLGVSSSSLPIEGVHVLVFGRSLPLHQISHVSGDVVSYVAISRSGELFLVPFSHQLSFLNLWLMADAMDFLRRLNFYFHGRLSFLV